MKKRYIYRRTCLGLSRLICAATFLSILLLFIPTVVSGQSVISSMTGTEYIVSGAEVTIQWDTVSNALAYEARLLMLYQEPVTYFALARIPASEVSVTFKQPRAGHFEAQVRTCKYADCHIEDPAKPEESVSGWSVSTDIDVATVDGVPMAWWIYWRLAPVTGPVISKKEVGDGGSS